MAQAKYKVYIDIDPADLGRMKGEQGMKELQSILRTLRRSIGARKGQFARAGIVSHALYSYEAESMFGMKKRPSIAKLTRNQLIMEVVKAQKFFKGKTSTVKGARTVQRNVEKRLFGEHTKRHLTYEESQHFWRVYNEFIRIHPDMYYRLGSDQLQRLIAEQVYDETRSYGTENFNLGEALEDATEYIEEWEDLHL